MKWRTFFILLVFYTAGFFWHDYIYRHHILIPPHPYRIPLYLGVYITFLLFLKHRLDKTRKHDPL